MAYPLSEYQDLLLRRARAKLQYAGLDSTTADAVNLDLVDAIREGLASLGLGAASLAMIADADLAPVDYAGASQLLDIAELRLLETVLGNRAAPDQKALNSYRFDGRFYNSLEKTVARVRDQVERQYGIGVPAITPGVIDLGFAETIDASTGMPG